MNTYRVESSAGVVLGDYQGENAGQAVGAMLRDAGSDAEVDYTESRSLFRRGGVLFLAVLVGSGYEVEE
jgi:hypothetical protein